MWKLSLGAIIQMTTQSLETAHENEISHKYETNPRKINAEVSTNFAGIAKVLDTNFPKNTVALPHVILQKNSRKSGSSALS